MASSQEDWQSTKNTVLERSRHMFNNPFMSDVVFTCEGSDTKFFAHKYVLVTSSTVFNAMFNGEPAENSEKNSDVHLSDVNEEGLQKFLQFLYTDKCDLTTNNAVMVLYLAKKYNIPSLAQECTEFIETNTTEQNVFTLLPQAIHFEEKELEKKFWKLIDNKASTAVASKAFTGINQGTLLLFLERETLKIDEVDLFRAVLKWSEAECSKKGIEGNGKNKRDVLGDAIHEIRFASLTSQEFTENISETGLLTLEERVLFFEVISGKERTSEVWNMSERGESLKKGCSLRCCRFTSYNPYFEKDLGTEHTIGVVFNKPVRIEGVRLFGSLGREYKVKFEVLDEKVKEKLYPKRDSRGVTGFDVMLPAPVKVQVDVPVHLKVTIKGSKSVFGYNGKEKIKINGVTVTFFNFTGWPNNQTSVECGQFDQIIFSRC